MLKITNVKVPLNEKRYHKIISQILNVREKEKQDSEIANARKSQVGSGDRSEKIRTYNYPQGRKTNLHPNRS